MKRTPLKRGNKQLKRTPFKKGKTSLKRTKLRKVSKASIALLQRKIWAILRTIVVERDGRTCYTCGATDLQGSNCQLGHMWPKASLGAFLKYDLRVLRIQCFRCNINLGGNGAVFYKKMLEEIGETKMKKLESDRNIIVNARKHYTELLEDLKE